MFAEILKTELKDSLIKLCEEKSLSKGMVRLLNTLGYYSQRTVENRFNVQEFLEVLEMNDAQLTNRQRDLFKLWTSVEILFQITESEILNQASLFDSYHFEDGRIESFLFLAVELAENRYSRTYLANTTRTVNSRFKMPVIILFKNVCNGSTLLTISVVHRRAHQIHDDQDVLEKVTLLKDINTKTPHRAHVDILANLALPAMFDAGIDSFDNFYSEWEKALDVEALNRRFYNEIFDWFRWVVDRVRIPKDGTNEKSTELRIIRLITRILFIWFLKEKELVPEELFENKFAQCTLKHHGPNKSDYYFAVLENLFFATLNTKISKRGFSTGTSNSQRTFNKYRYHHLLSDRDKFFDQLENVPFVNGGLFDYTNEYLISNEGEAQIHSFNYSTVQNKHLSISADFFFNQKKGLFSLLNHYKFTVEENTPLDQEVALDPELLGLVFENLLASYNPETRDSARKTTGSYYTPRRVVDYMVRKTLVDVLAKKIRPTVEGDGFWRARLSYLFDHSVAMDDADDFFEVEEKEGIVAGIANLKVLDPAVGSGAFPMGILQTLTLALRRLDPNNKLWEIHQKRIATKQIQKALDIDDQSQRDNTLKQISDMFQKYRISDFGRKLFLLQNTIYGVDIQPIACQITKLRFFISLLIEQSPDSNADNLGISPLPNLETQFVAADTLRSLERSTQSELEYEVVKTLLIKLITNREHYFHAADNQKKLRLREEDRNLRTQLANELQRIGFSNATAENITQWDPFDQNISAGWFDPEYMFGISSGFDVVISNPPYVESRNRLMSAEAKDVYGKQVRKDWGESLVRGSDLLIYFFARGAFLLHEEGIGCFITQNAWLSTNYGLKFQSFTKNRITFHKIIDTSSKFFSSDSDSNINAIVAFFSRMQNASIRTNNASIEYAVADAEMNIVECRQVQTKIGRNWGYSFSVPPFFDDLLNEFISTKLAHYFIPDISFGQGINVSKSVLDQPGATLGVISSRNAQFNLGQPDNKIKQHSIPKSRINKIPALIMPRGIGNRYYCSFNSCRAFSMSAVDVYLPEFLWKSDIHYCLWAYLNSSIAWLFREVNGRKNLGGGMLKAEATDMKFLPLPIKPNYSNEAKKILYSLKNREAFPIEKEIYTEEHLFIDNIVASYFDCQDIMQRIREELVRQVNARYSRAQTRS